MTIVSPSRGSVGVVDMVMSRAVIINSNFTQAASYAAGNNLGGLLTLDVGAATGLNMANQLVRVRKCAARVAASTVTAAGAINVVFFSGLPAATFTDAAAVTLSAADSALIACHLAMTFNITTFTGAGLATTANASDEGIVCDSGGKIYVALIANATHTYTTPGKLNIDVELMY